MAGGTALVQSSRSFVFPFNDLFRAAAAVLEGCHATVFMDK
jgi:hypothetical protein